MKLPACAAKSGRFPVKSTVLPVRSKRCGKKGMASLEAAHSVIRAAHGAERAVVRQRGFYLELGLHRGAEPGGFRERFFAANRNSGGLSGKRYRRDPSGAATAWSGSGRRRF